VEYCVSYQNINPDSVLSKFIFLANQPLELFPGEIQESCHLWLWPIKIFYTVVQMKVLAFHMLQNYRTNYLKA